MGMEENKKRDEDARKKVDKLRQRSYKDRGLGPDGQPMMSADLRNDLNQISQQHTGKNNPWF